MSKKNTMEKYFSKLPSSFATQLSSNPDIASAPKEQCDTEPVEKSTPNAETEQQSSKPGKKVPTQKFRNEWLTIDGFECYEQYERDVNFAWCKLCLDKLSIIKGGKSNLVSHLETKRHKEAAAKIAESAAVPKINKLVTNSSKVTEAELKISGWAVENNISFAAVDKLTGLLKTLDPDSKVFSKLTLGRTKATAVVNGVIAEVQHEELVEMMKISKFSLIVDESTDIGAVKTLAMVIRMVEDNGNEVFRVRDYFHKAVELHLANSQTIYNAIVQQLHEDGIDYKKHLVGFGSDGASVMMGSEKSVMRLLKNDCPALIVIKCSCHSLALCASYACEKLPSYLEQLLRDIYSYLSCSPKRSKEYAMIQSILEVKPLKQLHPSATRWLSLESVVKRNIDRFSELIMFFTFQSNCDNNSTAQRILHHLNDPMTKPLLHFLQYVLPLVNKVNRIFQSENPEFTNMYSEIKSLLLILLSNICEDDFLKKYQRQRFSKL
ncbi:uncharacterized protein LOC134202271 [Armigeres subalbatus]|uniref:uncharacterized protein LOC134202271 n=1 Tax=Armigeres subalbatus TaxID=124917 RepID=UPI002ED4977D